MKLSHCSDLHLDSPMETHLSGEQARARSQELCGTFARLMAWAREQEVTAVIVAGDLFDSERVTARTVDLVLDAVAGAPGVDVLYLRGNHDESRRAFAGRSLPDNLKTFTDHWTSLDYGPVTVWGLDSSALGRPGVYDELRPDRSRVNLAALHGQVSTRAGEELVCLPALRGKGLAYLALGHLHSFRRERLDGDGEYCYSGCLEGRGFDECGEKGFVLLDVDGGRVRPAFIPFARRTLWEVEADVTGLTTAPELLRALEGAAEGLSPDSLVKFVLTGTHGPDVRPDLPFLRQALEDRFWFVRVEDGSRLTVDRRDYAHDVSLKGAFVRRVLASDLPEEEKERAISLGLQALRGEEVVL